MSKKPVSKLRLVLVKDEYAEVAGEYSRTDAMVRDKNIWITERGSDDRLMFYNAGLLVDGYLHAIQTANHGRGYGRIL